MFSLAIDTGCSTLIATAIKDFQNVYYGYPNDEHSNFACSGGRR